VSELDERTVKHITKLIINEVSYFNGWSVPQETMEADCKKAADKISKYLSRKTWPAYISKS